MRKALRNLALVFGLTAAGGFTFAQTEDAEGCKDHPFFSRLEKFFIQECTQNYDQYEFVLGEDSIETFDGAVTKIVYTYDGPYGPGLPSKLQVVKNYENAVLKMGGTKIYSRTADDGSWTGATFYLSKDGTEHWLGIYHLINNPVDQFTLVLLTKETMRQEITAKQTTGLTDTENSQTSSDDAENCKDHDFFTRFEKFYIQECKENYNEYAFVTGEDMTEVHEGTVTEILYTYSGSYGPHLPSKFQVVKNYENAIIAMGGKKLYAKTKDDGNWTGATFHLEKDGNEYWIGIYDLINNPVDQFSFVLLKKEAMTQEITSSEMFETVNAGNPLVLYINFENGKSIIRSESQVIVDELYAMLNENAALRIVIEGHTDNTGDEASNQVLSEKRALSVKKALVDKGISADRIQTQGYGQSKPLADNSTEDGRAMNRRVEIRKL